MHPAQRNSEIWLLSGLLMVRTTKCFLAFNFWFLILPLRVLFCCCLWACFSTIPAWTTTVLLWISTCHWLINLLSCFFLCSLFFSSVADAPLLLVFSPTCFYTVKLLGLRRIPFCISWCSLAFGNGDKVSTNFSNALLTSGGDEIDGRGPLATDTSGKGAVWSVCKESVDSCRGVDDDTSLLVGLHCQLSVQEDPSLKQSTPVNITHKNYRGKHTVRPTIFVIMYKIIEKV